MESRPTTADQLLGDPSAVKWGYLSKKGGDRRNWTHRFFILKQNNDSAGKIYVIEYHKDHKVFSLPIFTFLYILIILPIYHFLFGIYSHYQNLKKPKGVIAINKDTVVSHSNRKNFCFSIKTESREYLIQAKSGVEVDEWKQAIERCVTPIGSIFKTMQRNNI